MFEDVWDWVMLLQLLYTIGGFVLLASYLVQQLVASKRERATKPAHAASRLER